MVINAGLNKFFNYIPVPKNMPEDMVRLTAAFVQIKWLMPLVGFAEIVGGTLFIIPKLRALGAIVAFPVIIGIFLSNIVNSPIALPIAVVLLVVNVWVIFEERRKYLPMIR
jgi:uncharacterized membrane protein YphA (DoxX/SURF4 family)